MIDMTAAVESSTWRSTTGTSLSPASMEARWRRSPQMSSIFPSARRRQVSGWMTPFSRMDSTRSSNSSRRNSVRGWNGQRTMSCGGTCRTFSVSGTSATGAGAGAPACGTVGVAGTASSRGAAGAMSASRPPPRPRPTRPKPPCFCWVFRAARFGGFGPAAFLRKGFSGLSGFFCALMDTSPED